MRTLSLVAAIVLTQLSCPTSVRADAVVLQQINALRADAGRAPVTYSSELERIARGHAEDMARNGFFDHQGSDGSSLADRARRARYGFCFLAENIAKGQRTQSDVMESWYNSRGHRRNMLDRRASEFGLARADGAIWVMVLGRPGC